MFSSSKNDSKSIEDINRHRLNHKPWRLDIFKSTLAQALARVDVPTARVFPAWTMESNMSASFCVNAWICDPQATDRDLESFENAWICTCQATDRDLESVFVKRKVNAWICACQATDRDLETKR